MFPRFILVLLLLALASPAAAETEPTSARLAQRIDLFELWIGDWMAAHGQPGVAIGIVSGPKLVWGEGFGVADLETGRAVTPETVFRLGSISKTFTATAVLQLRDAGKLRLDDPVAEHLPWLTYRDHFPEGPRITLWHLLTHTSGLPRDAAFPYWTDREFPTLDELKTALADQEIVYEPGTRYKYSNLGLALLGHVVAAVSGQKYHEYVRRHILEPLGMASTFVNPGGVPPARLATGYLARGPNGSPPEAPTTEARALAPSADLSSTVFDLARYLSGHLGALPGVRLLAPATLREMHRVHWLYPSWSGGRALGFAVWRQGERTLVGHGGWVAGHRAQIAFDRENQIGVVVLTNGDEGGPGAYLRQAFELLAPALTGDAPAASPAGYTRYTGTYSTPWGERSSVVVVDGKLAIYDHSRPPTDDPLGSLVELVPDGEESFAMTGKNGNGEGVVFELTEDGRVARVKVAQNYIYPEGCGNLDSELRCTWE